MYIPPFTITEKILNLVAEISEQVGILTTNIVNNVPSPMLRKKNQIRTIHSSLAIENNSLTLKQVTDIIEGKHVLGAPDEIQEVKNAIESIAQCDAMGDSTLFIEFMLECLLNAMENYEEDEEEVQDKVQDKIQDKFPEVGHTTWDVLDIIRERPKSTVNDICSQLNLKERQVYKHISQLKKLGIIVRVGSNKTGYWKVNID